MMKDTVQRQTAVSGGASVPRFLLVGNGAYANRGCEAITRGTVEILSSRFSGAPMTLCSFGFGLDLAQSDADRNTDGRVEHHPHGPVLRRFSLPWWKSRLRYPGSDEQPKREFRVELDAARSADCILHLAGDNYTTDYDGLAGFVQMDQLMRSTGKTAVIWGASMGPFRSSETESAVSRHLREFELILARESDTVTYLASLGVEHNVRLVADPAFAMSPSEPVLTDQLSAFVNRSPVGLNLSPLVGEFRSERGSDWLSVARECIGALVDAGIGPVLLIPHVFDVPENDYDFLKSAAERLPAWGSDIAIIPPHLSSPEIKWVISRTRAFVGARMHSTIAAISSCVPTMTIGYSAKSHGVNKDVWGSLDWWMPIDEVTPASLVERLGLVLSREDGMRAHLKSRVPELVDLAYGAGDHLADLLSNNMTANAEMKVGR